MLGPWAWFSAGASCMPQHPSPYQRRSSELELAENPFLSFFLSVGGSHLSQILGFGCFLALQSLVITFLPCHGIPSHSHPLFQPGCCLGHPARSRAGNHIFPCSTCPDRFPSTSGKVSNPLLVFSHLPSGMLGSHSARCLFL